MSEEKITLFSASAIKVKQKYFPVGLGVWIGVFASLFLVNPEGYEGFSIFSYALVNGLFSMLIFLVIFAVLDPVGMWFWKLFTRIRKTQ